MLVLIAAILSAYLTVPYEAVHVRLKTALASRYADTVRDEGGTPAAWRRCLIVDTDGNCVQRFPDTLFNMLHPYRCAHRTLSMGTLVYIRTVPRMASESSQETVCAVLDTGPWCRVGKGCKRTGGPFRGDLDLSPQVADAVGLKDGRVMVSYVPLFQLTWTAKSGRVKYRRRNS